MGIGRVYRGIVSIRIVFFVFGFVFVALVTALFLFVPIQEKSAQPEIAGQDNLPAAREEIAQAAPEVIEEEPASGVVKPASAESFGAAREDNDESGIRAVYLTTNSAGSEGMINYVIDLAHTTQINAVVLDIKDFSGRVAYHDFALARFHEENIYVIGRLTVFQDPILANSRPELAVHNKRFLSILQEIDVDAKPSLATVWRDNKGLAWVDPASKEVWDYNVAVAKTALEKGYEEINFDYIRFPSDGNLQDMMFLSWDEETPKRETISAFFAYLREELSGGIISADLFGLSTIKYDDIGIGQVIEDAFEYFDYVSPMVYPSHYANGFLGYENPAEHPYEVIKYSLDSALKRLKASPSFAKASEGTANLRPWLQDFDLGAEYGEEKVRAEIQAVKDALGEDYVGYMIWAPTNIYTDGAFRGK